MYLSALLLLYLDLFTQKERRPITLRDRKGTATRREKDVGKAGQTLSLLKQEGKSRKKQVGQERSGREGKSGICRARAIPSKKVTGREWWKWARWGGQKTHNWKCYSRCCNALVVQPTWLIHKLAPWLIDNTLVD